MALWDFFAKQDYHALRHYRFFSFQLAETKVLATRQNQPETLLMEKNLLNKKSQELENLLAENQTQTQT